jgi:peptide/nickel transport system permease protein
VQLIDLAAHLVLPAAILALGPAVAIARYLRAEITLLRDADWVVTMRAFGLDDRLIERRVLRAAARPLWTWFGSLLPLFVTGAVVVEEMFALPGFGRLAFRAAVERELATVTTTTLLAAANVLVGLVVSDLLHRWADPRVVLR